VHLKKREKSRTDFTLNIESPASGGSISATDLMNTGATGTVSELASISATLFSTFPTNSKAADSIKQPTNSDLSWNAKFNSVSAGSSYCLVVQATANVDGSVVGATVNFTVP
jgi:hypothetical protein